MLTKKEPQNQSPFFRIRPWRHRLLDLRPLLLAFESSRSDERKSRVYLALLSFLGSYSLVIRHSVDPRLSILHLL